MSQFHFPRINFWGKASINPSTANNNFFAPLVHYDPINLKAIIPPRIYLNKQLISLYQLGGLPLPSGNNPNTTNDGHLFIEIDAIDTKSKFREWIKTPLGSCRYDADFHELYEVVIVQRSGESLTGGVPAFWNYYGGLEFSFEDVKVQSIEVIKDGIPHLYQTESTDLPTELKPFMEAVLETKTSKGRNAAAIVDVVPSRSFYSQVFCDSFILSKNKTSLMAGKPFKASLRLLNTHRIVNEHPLLTSSGYFFTAIPLKELEGESKSIIMDLMNKYKQKELALKGVFIRYNLFELKENYNPDYKEIGTSSNPAFATLAGSITPWYEGEMKSISMGRQLVSDAPFYEQCTLPPTIFCIDEKRKVIILDLLGTIPEEKKESTESFETFNLGELVFRWVGDDHTEVEIGRLIVDEENLGRATILKRSGIVELYYGDLPSQSDVNWEDGKLEVERVSTDSNGRVVSKALLLKEIDYMVASDQAGLYAEEGGGDGTMFRSYSHQKEPCVVRVYKKGKPHIKPISMTILEWKTKSPFGKHTVREILKTDSFKDGYELKLPIDEPANAMYVFFPEEIPQSNVMLLQSILHKGFFVNLRVLPRHDYGKYLDPNHDKYPTPVTFEVIYQEILGNFDLIYPQSSIITPFTEDFFVKGRHFIKSRMHPQNWGSYSYMPTSRELSQDQWELFCKWFENP